MTEFKYSSDEKLPEKIASARTNATKLLKATLNLEEQVAETEAIENGNDKGPDPNGTNNGDIDNTPVSDETA